MKPLAKVRSELGRDVFMFFSTSKGFRPAGDIKSQKGADDAALVANCFSGSAGQGGILFGALHCASWVLESGNMDYLKAVDGKCPNGKQLGWTVKSCN